MTAIGRKLRAGFNLACWEVVRRFRDSITVSTHQGKLTVLTGRDESIGRSLYCSGEHELGLVEDALGFLRGIGRLPPKGRGAVLDIGANNGVISIGMLHAGEFEKAVAVEPEPRNFSLLLRNVEQNRFFCRVWCIPCAVSDVPGEVPLELSCTNFGDHRVRFAFEAASAERFNESSRKVIGVRCETVDGLVTGLRNVLPDGVSLIWVDVQGNEGRVFSGARRLLSAGTPVVSEIWPYGILRAGMSRDEFCDIVRGIWSGYWVRREGGFVRQPIEAMGGLFDELGSDGGFCSVIFSDDRARFKV